MGRCDHEKRGFAVVGGGNRCGDGDATWETCVCDGRVKDMGM